jgi:HEAT repeat protein
MSSTQKIIGVFAVFISIVLVTLLSGDGKEELGSEQETLLQKIADLETQVEQLQKQLAIKPQGFKLSNGTIAAQAPSNTVIDNANPITQHAGPQELPAEYQALDKLRNLASASPAEAAALLQTLAENNRDNKNSPVIARGVYDLSKDSQSLPNDLLTSIYSNQTDLDVKRVSAQVLAQRGDNSLLEKYIAENAGNFTHNDPSERSAALHALSKTGSKLAAGAIQPLLKDPDTSVRMDALLALRATGNQSHVNGVKHLLNDPDENLRDLARDVIDNLSHLNENAHTKISDADISQALIGYEDSGTNNSAP